MPTLPPTNTKKPPTAPLLALLLLPACSEAPRPYSFLGPTTMAPLCSGLAAGFCSDYPDRETTWKSASAGRALKRLTEGRADVVFSRRGRHEREVARHRELGADVREHVVARAELAVFVHPDNPVSALPAAPVVRLLRGDGECPRWSELGVDLGPGRDDDQLIVAVEQTASFAVEVLGELLLGGEAPATDRLVPLPTRADVLSYCARHRNAIGLATPPPGGCEMRAVELVDGGGRPLVLSRPIYVFTRGERAAEFVCWLRSPAGRRLFAAHGLVPPE